MKTVILCGGYGTRIRSVDDNIPKPMIPIGNLPILWHIIKYYSSWGFKDFILCLGYKSNVIKDFFLNYNTHVSDFTMSLGDNSSIQYHHKHSEVDWKITFAETGQNAMTGARVKKIQKYIGDDERFMLTYGDAVGNIDIKSLIEFHKTKDRILTITGVHPPGRFGEVMSDPAGIVTEFNEKPQAIAGIISGGYFVCKNEIFDYLNDDEDLVFEQEPMNNLVKDQQMAVYNFEGFWQPMDTFRDYKLLNQLYQQGKAPWLIW